MAFLLVLRALGKELSVFQKSKKIVLTWFLGPDTCRFLWGVRVEVIIFLAILVLYSKLSLGILISWRIFEEQWFLWRIAVLQSSDIAALHMFQHCILILFWYSLYTIIIHYKCFLSHGITYPSYKTLELRKSKTILFFGAGSFERKNGTTYTRMFCCVLPPCALKISVWNQKITWVKKEALCLVDR